MSISTTVRKAGPYIGNNAATVFGFAFKVFLDADLLAVETETETGTDTVLTLDSDYSVSLNADQDNNPGGTITLLKGALATGFTLVITTAIAELQPTAVTNQSGFYPDILNNALDLVTILVQQLKEQAGRALTFPVSDSSPAALPAPALRAGTLLGFDAAGGLALLPVAPGTGVPGAQAATGTVDGANQNFSFVAAGSPTPVPLVYLGGIFQRPGIDYGALVSLGGNLWRIPFVNAPIAVDPASPPAITVVLLA